VLTALLALPVGASDCEMKQARDAVLAPIRATTQKARADEQARRDAEARAQKDRADRDAVVGLSLALSFPFDMPEADRAKATKAARMAVAALPAGTPKRNLEAARDRAVKPYLDAHGRRQK
jgi:hypothetical protein